MMCNTYIRTSGSSQGKAEHLYFIRKLFASTLADVSGKCFCVINLFLFPLCLALFYSVPLSPFLSPWSTNKTKGGWGDNNNNNISSFHTRAVRLRMCPDRFKSNLLSVCSLVLLLTGKLLLCFHRTQIARGNLK